MTDASDCASGEAQIINISGKRDIPMEQPETVDQRLLGKVALKSELLDAK